MNYAALDPTYDNIKDALCKDSIGRNKFLYKFISILEKIDGSCSIAVDADWGAGKTFFVKQVKLILDSYNSLIDLDNTDRESIMTCFEKIDKSDVIFADNPMLTVYYDAWSNDNDEDPILSLIYSIVMSLNTINPLKEMPKLICVCAAIADALSGRNLSGLLKALKSDDNLQTIKKQKSIESLVKDFLDSLGDEIGNRVIIIVDELDRCRPEYAVRFLERIKHYFNNSKLTFVFSTNISELHKTVKRFYGEDLEATMYLDRFFDLRIPLPPIDIDLFLKQQLIKQYVFDDTCELIVKEYHFQMRQILRYIHLCYVAAYKPAHLQRSTGFGDGNTREFLNFYFVPIVIGLELLDITRYRNFILGNTPQELNVLYKSAEDRIDRKSVV